MLAAWAEILPLFVVKWLARRHCEMVIVKHGKNAPTYVTARPDVLVKMKQVKR